MDGVPAFLAKIARYRPRVVCVVGVGIWRTIEKVLIKLVSRNIDGRAMDVTSPSPSKSGKGKSKKSGPARLGLQPYKLVHTDHSELIGILSTH